ncbi:MAG: putative Ig domain-containing protein [Candidatus Aminicenantes bacterium]|nr:putative Ig domain-containing protein [Candidatus Aminicenantes bacterium]
MSDKTGYLLKLYILPLLLPFVWGCGSSLKEHNDFDRGGQPAVVAQTVYGHRPGTPLHYTIAAFGQRPMTFRAEGLPLGLDLDAASGIISGVVEEPGEYPVRFNIKNAVGKCDVTVTFKIGDHLALTPPMGWMSWNQFGPNISENLFREIADALVESGMRDVGYQYIFIDDLWHGDRDDEGFIHPDPEKFPNGLRAVADYVHSKGLKLGIYSDAAERTCAGEPGSYGFEEKDALTYAKWGMDYLKYDYCGAPEDVETAKERYTAMSRVLALTDRTIVLGICEWGPRKPWEWGRDAGGQLWRTSWDIRDRWEYGKYRNGITGILEILDRHAGLEKYAGPGGWNDPDMLIVGLKGNGLYTNTGGAEGGCTEDEYRSNMSLWCLLAAPLYASCDIRNMDGTTREILTNPEAIMVNQDVLGRQAARVFKDGDIEIWAKPLADGHLAVGLLNRGEEAVSITTVWDILGINGRYAVRDLWAHEEIGRFKGSFTLDVKSHETRLLRLRQAK